MTRIQQSKTFISVLIAAFVIFIAANFYYLGPVKGLGALLAIELFIIWNNRKQKESLKSFNIARKLYKKQRYEEAITMFLTFIKEVKEEPEKEKTTILNFGIYTNSAIAMSYNNIGASCIELGHFAKAIESLERSIEVDADYAIPYYNLAVIATARGEDEKVNRYIEKMHALGYKISIEEIINKTESLVAEVIEEVKQDNNPIDDSLEESSLVIIEDDVDDDISESLE